MNICKIFTILALSAITLPAISGERMLCGGDISLLPRYEQNGARYLDQNGARITDMLSFFHNNGWTLMRVRLFVDPANASTEHKGQGVCQDLEYVKALGARIKAAGFKFLLDFHYSDSWADPSMQFTPAAWAGLTDDQLYQAIYNYTADCLQQLVDAGAAPDYIQTGNEISYGMLWGTADLPVNQQKRCYTSNDNNWQRFTNLLSWAGKACREVCPQAKIIIHTERVGNTSTLNGFYGRLRSAAVDYDIIGLSYYPFYHGYLSQLERAISLMETDYPTKDIMIVETGYYHAYQPTEGINYHYESTYPISGTGQAAFLRDLIAMMSSHERVIGLCWWWPEANEYGLNWSTKRVTDAWYNAGMWDNATGRALPAVAMMGTAAVNEVTIDHNDTDHPTGTYTLDGRRLSDGTPETPGIYIVDGKKTIVH